MMRRVGSGLAGLVAGGVVAALVWLPLLALFALVVGGGALWGQRWWREVGTANGAVLLSVLPTLSTFILYLPVTYSVPRLARKSADGLSLARPSSLEELRPSLSSGSKTIGEDEPALPSVSDADAINEVGDDRDVIQSGDRVLLIVENDQSFSRFLLDVAREKGYKGLVTSMGATALSLAREYKPDCISLDLHLPDVDGWRVLERLKHDTPTRHVPVCVISTDDSRERALASGVLAFVAKPIQSRDVIDRLLDEMNDFIARSTRHLLVIEPDPARRAQIIDCVSAEDVQVTAIAESNGQTHDRRVDCVVVGPRATELPGWMQPAGGEFGRLPVIVYGDAGAGTAWDRLSPVYTIRHAHVLERLLDLTAFFMHRNVAQLPEAKRQMLLSLSQSERELRGRRVLIVDDDVRNIFALSAVLEEYEMVVSSAVNGRDAIRMLRDGPGAEIVLMDVMMPEMDGLQTMREIRKIPKLKNLPIVAVTAKAMKGDREKCIDAGAWDYLSKPVDVEQMLAVLRAWLHCPRSAEAPAMQKVET